MLTRKTKHALRALVRLAREPRDTPVLIGNVATQERLPRKFLELILLELKAAGIVRSVRGRLGGYALAVPPSEVSVAQVLRIVEGPIALLPCASKTAYARCDDCGDEATCALRRVAIDVRDASLAILERTTLADLLASAGAPEAQARPCAGGAS